MLRVQQSEEAVRDASRVRLLFQGTMVCRVKFSHAVGRDADLLARVNGHNPLPCICRMRLLARSHDGRSLTGWYALECGRIARWNAVVLHAGMRRYCTLECGGIARWNAVVFHAGMLCGIARWNAVIDGSLAQWYALEWAGILRWPCEFACFQCMVGLRCLLGDGVGVGRGSSFVPQHSHQRR
jgi:hypothetical protein